MVDGVHNLSAPADDLDDAPAVTADESPTLNPLPAALVSTLALSLAACGGGGGGGGGSSGGGSPPPPPPPPPPPVSLNETQAARFLLQAQFSASDADNSAVRSQGPTAWLNAQMNVPIAQTGWDWLDSKGYNAITSEQRYFWLQFGDFMVWNQLITAPDQVRKRAALALSELFVVSLSALDSFWPSHAIAAYWDILNANAFGNFRTLLGQITLNPAMGAFLNTKGNRKENNQGRQPDENYAREVMQLFTIGIYQLNNDGSIKTDSSGNKLETYTQSDITNLARVFTGYDHDMTGVTRQTVSWVNYQIPTYQFVRTPMALFPDRHSNLEVNFLGTRIPANTDPATALNTALDTLFNHPNVGPFFARQMIQRLVTSNPSPGYINRVASAFNNNGSGVRGDLRAVWRAILTDSEALSLPAQATGGKLREPVVRFTQFCRTAGVTTATDVWALYDQSNTEKDLGQSPLRSPSVFNFFRPGYVPPNTALGDQGLTAPEFQIVNETTTAGYLNAMMNFMRYGYNDVKADFSALVPIAHDTAALLDWVNLHMTARQLSADTLSVIRQALDATPLTTDSTLALKMDRLRSAFFLVMASPEYLVQK